MSKNIFNTPLEIGLRALYLLNSLEGRPIDLQRLVYYDYFLVHSKDVKGGPSSLHPSLPLRSGEVLVKRESLKEGLLLMHKKELVKILFDSEGIKYSTSDIAGRFLSYLKSEYAKILSKRAGWVAKKFSRLSDVELRKYVEGNLSRWGSEFFSVTE